MNGDIVIIDAKLKYAVFRLTISGFRHADEILLEACCSTYDSSNEGLARSIDGD
jgi:hypothetical protein